MRSASLTVFTIIVILGALARAANQEILLPPSVGDIGFSAEQGRNEHAFILQQIFFAGVDRTASLHFCDVPKTTANFSAGSGPLEQWNLHASLGLRSHMVPIQQLSSALTSNRQSHLQGDASPQWVVHHVLGPDITDKSTIINLARTTSDAYYPDPSTPGWMNTSFGFNQSFGFGWQGDGLRGQVFADATNKTVIIAFKGTSIDPRDKWTVNDRLNDNILFSCCCATQRPDPYWYGNVCNCRTDTYQCNSTCLTQELSQKDHYYAAAVEVYHNVSRMYPESQIWLTGHSMGGAMASLIGLTFSLPAVTFEAVPQKLPAQRLGLQVPPDPRLTGAYHFGNSADPVFMGACNGYFSSCSIAGFAFESQCFTGMRCEYDTVGDKGWRMNINNHRINNVIPQVLEAYDTVANCSLDEECSECFNWRFDLNTTAESW